MQIRLTPSLILTNEHSESDYGIPVLVRLQDDSTAYGPADMIDHEGTQRAAHLVARYGKQLKGKEREFVQLFLKQWPEGPQLAEKAGA